MNKFAFGTHDYQIYYVDIDLRHQYGISVTESQTFLRVKRPQRRRGGKTAIFAGYFDRFSGMQIAFFVKGVMLRRYYCLGQFYAEFIT